MQVASGCMFACVRYKLASLTTLFYMLQDNDTASGAQLEKWLDESENFGVLIYLCGTMLIIFVYSVYGSAYQVSGYVKLSIGDMQTGTARQV